MPILNAIDPTPNQIERFLSHKLATEPVYMLNLLKFKDKAEYKDGEDISGREAYLRYVKAFGELTVGHDVKMVFNGQVNSFLIGEGDGEWDAMMLIKYATAQSMFSFVSSDAYRQIHKHRRAGLAGQLLISCDDQFVPKWSVS